MTQASKYTGSCHCGAVRYQVAMAPPAKAFACNCSICSRNGWLLTFVDEAAFTLTAGAPKGEIAAIEHEGQTRLVIHDGELERLVPLVAALVPSIDIDARVVTIDVPADWPTSRR